MKRLTILLCMMLLAFISMSAQAQIKIPKSTKELSKSTDVNIPERDISKDLLKAITPGKGLDISPDKMLKLNKHNKGFVKQVLGVIGGAGSDADKLNLLKGKQKERKDFITNLLGEGKAATYYQLIKPQVEPLIKKYAMAKFFL